MPQLFSIYTLYEIVLFNLNKNAFSFAALLSFDNLSAIRAD